MLKSLRIAVTVLSLIACALLIALWVRSYWTGDNIGKSGVEMSSANGVVQFGVLSPPSYSGWLRTSFPVNDQFPPLPAFTSVATPSLSYINVPHWFLLLILCAIAATPWISWSSRFSLRTLLIATTLVAGVLGAIAFYSTRHTAPPPIDVRDFGSPYGVTR